MKLNLLLSILFSLAASSSAADNKIGNGGDVVSCASKTLLLDFYEGDFTPESKSQDPFKSAETAIDRLRDFAPKLHEHYSKRAKSIATEIDFKDGIELIDLDDSKHLFKPSDKNCSVKQIAIRKSQVESGEKRFVVDKDLWQKLSATHKAGLIVHEIVYEHLFQVGEKDSIKVRKLTRLLFSEDLNGEKFWKTVKHLKVPIYP